MITVVAKQKRLPPQHVIFYYRGKDESHARLRATLRCKAWKVRSYADTPQGFEDFLIEFIRFMEDGNWAYPKGETQKDEDWLLTQIQQLLS